MENNKRETSNPTRSDHKLNTKQRTREKDPNIPPSAVQPVADADSDDPATSSASDGEGAATMYNSDSSSSSKSSKTPSSMSSSQATPSSSSRNASSLSDDNSQKPSTKSTSKQQYSPPFSAFQHVPSDKIMPLFWSPHLCKFQQVTSYFGIAVHGIKAPHREQTKQNEPDATTIQVTSTVVSAIRNAIDRGAFTTGYSYETSSTGTKESMSEDAETKTTSEDHKSLSSHSTDKTKSSKDHDSGNDTSHMETIKVSYKAEETQDFQARAQTKSKQSNTPSPSYPNMFSVKVGVPPIPIPSTNNHHEVTRKLIIPVDLQLVTHAISSSHGEILSLEVVPGGLSVDQSSIEYLGMIPGFPGAGAHTTSNNPFPNSSSFAVVAHVTRLILDSEDAPANPDTIFQATAPLTSYFNEMHQPQTTDKSSGAHTVPFMMIRRRQEGQAPQPQHPHGTQASNPPVEWSVMCRRVHIKSAVKESLVSTFVCVLTVPHVGEYEAVLFLDGRQWCLTTANDSTSPLVKAAGSPLSGSDTETGMFSPQKRLKTTFS